MHTASRFSMTISYQSIQIKVKCFNIFSSLFDVAHMHMDPCTHARIYTHMILVIQRWNNKNVSFIPLPYHNSLNVTCFSVTSTDPSNAGYSAQVESLLTLILYVFTSLTDRVGAFQKLRGSIVLPSTPEMSIGTLQFNPLKILSWAWPASGRTAYVSCKNKINFITEELTLQAREKQPEQYLHQYLCIICTEKTYFGCHFLSMFQLCNHFAKFHEFWFWDPTSKCIRED